MTLVSLARAANATIASKPASTAVPRKNDALRSLRTPGTESPRRVTPGQRPTDETYNLFGQFGVGTPRWHSSPRESELRNPHLGWIRFRGQINVRGGSSHVESRPRQSYRQSSEIAVEGPRARKAPGRQTSSSRSDPVGRVAWPRRRKANRRSDFSLTR